MGRTVSELSAILPVDEWVHWIAFNSHYPIGDERYDYLFANLCAQLSAAFGAKRKDGGSIKFSDFLIYKPFEEEKPEPKQKTPREFLEALIGHHVAHKPKPKDLQ